MTEAQADFIILDVGCGTMPKGDVNVDFFRGDDFNPQTGDQVQGAFMSREKIPNFVIADASCLPFKDESFNVVFSSHTIEHVEDPLLVLKEMCRVAKRKVIVRFPHRKGSGAVMPHHLNYLDEVWFKKASEILGFASAQFMTIYDHPLSSRLKRFCPMAVQASLPWRALRHIERAHLNFRVRIPFEMESWTTKRRHCSNSSRVKFVVVCNNPSVFEKCFASSPFVSPNGVIAHYNLKHEPLPKIFNTTVEEHLQENLWFAFCHQDFILREDLANRLMGSAIEAIYGPTGARLAENMHSGMIIQTDGTPSGRLLKEDTPVQTLDEMCLIAHSELFRQGLSFDERFSFHFYGADLCMQAYTLGFDVIAKQIDCTNKSRTLSGVVSSPEYESCLNKFKEKWKKFLPIKTTTAIVT